MPVSDARDYERAFAQAGCSTRVHILEGADHRFTSIAWRERIIGELAGWFSAHLLEPAQ